MTITSSSRKKAPSQVAQVLIASAFLGLFAFSTQPDGFCAGADDHGVGVEGVPLDGDRKGTRTQIHGFDVFVLNLQAETFGLFAEFHHHLRATDTLGVAGEVLDVRGEHQLPPRHVAGEHQRLQHCTRGIETSGVSSRA